MGVHWRPIPTEAPWGIGRNDRHHSPIRDAYIRITAETPALAPDLALAMAYKARNDAIRAHGSSPTTSVTGEAPHLLIGDNHHADPTIAARHHAMQTARATMEAYTAADRLRGALAHPGATVPFVEVGKAVWFHRDRQGWLRGTVHSPDGKTVYVRHNRRLFSSHESRTKPYVSRRPPPSPASPAQPVSTSASPIRTHTPAPPAPAQVPAHSRVFLTSPADPASPSTPRWNAAKATELAVFNAIACTTSLPSSNVPADKQIFHYLWRVTHKANRGNGKLAERARFCVAGNRDWNKNTTVATSPVIPQRAIRAVVAASFILSFTLHTEDLLRAYLQSDRLAEPVYVWAPPEAGEPDNTVWAFHRAMYGKNDSGCHIHFITQSRFLTIPNITLNSAFDIIYLVPLHGAISTCVDDTLNAGDAPFLSSVNTILKSYSTHRPDHGTIQFAGICARSDAAAVHGDAGPYAATTAPLPLTPPLPSTFTDPKSLHSLAAQLLWVGRVARPDVLTNARQLANIPNRTGADARRANDTLATLARLRITLHYPRLDRATLQVSFFAEYSGFAVSPLPKRQVGYLIALVDASHRSFLLHWASHRPHRVCRGSCAGELLALADAVAAVLDMRLLLSELLSRRVPMAAYTDSSAAYDLITSFKDPTDMTGKNGLFMLRRALLDGTVRALHLVQGAHNHADALSKPTYARPAPNASLNDALSSGMLRPIIRAYTTSADYRNAPRPLAQA